MKWRVELKIAILILQTISADDLNNRANIYLHNSDERIDTYVYQSNVSGVTEMYKNKEYDLIDKFAQDISTKELIKAKNVTEGGINDADYTEPVNVFNDMKTSEVVLTEYGPVMGHIEDQVRRFIDIPYGKVEGIFQAPLKPDVKEDLHDKLLHDVKCPQLTNEDTLLGLPECLTLSVFTPIESHNASVLFHIHDGSLNTGSGDPAVYGPENIVSNNIIVILPNYRLGPLGFLCLGSDLAPGNAAIKDLSLALEWTVKNIEKFGGNPNDIAVSGEDTSGALAGFLALSKKSSHFVSKVITESGSFLSHLGLDRDPNATAFELAKNFMSDNDSYNVQVILETALTDLLIKSKNITFKPCVEMGSDGFITESPWRTLSESVIDKTFMIGSANIAGYDDAVKTLEYFEPNEDWSQILPDDLYFPDSGDTKKRDIANEIKALYVDSNITGSNEKDIEALTVYHTDASYLGPDIRAARALIKAGASVYLYEFSYTGETNSELDPRVVLGGALKGDVIGFLFTKSGELPIENPSDEAMVATLTSLWTNFIKTGIPASEDIVWNQFSTTTAEREPWLSIGHAVVPKTGFYINRLGLWTRIYDEYYIDRSGVGRKQLVLPYVWAPLIYIAIFK